jgi:hypothetical protein
VKSVIDHIVVVAPDLAVGAAFVSKVLGVELQQGGAHPRMATHNLLLRLGESSYLEVIAPDPSVARPPHPRWFALDHLAPDSPPLLAAWVVRTDDIRSASLACGPITGNIESMSRGHLSWRITVPQDGSLPLGGAAPALIEWQGPAHPAGTLRDVGCALTLLEIFHPEPLRVQALLKAVNLEAPISFRQLSAAAKPVLVAHVQTPRGHCKLSSPWHSRAWDGGSCRDS